MQPCGPLSRSRGLLLDLPDVKFHTTTFEDGHLKPEEDLDQFKLASSVRISGEKVVVGSLTTGIVNS